MTRIKEGTVGILPAGALGVAFFYHLTAELARADGRVFFVQRTGSASGEALRSGGVLQVAAREGVISLRNREIWRPDLLACFADGFLPEVLLLCTQPDQILQVLNSCVRLVEQAHEKGLDPVDQLPLLVLCSNGIYFQRVRQFFIEKLEDATLMGRLPDLWPEAMPRLIARLLRGVTIQTGQREGAGEAAIYHPGPRGRTRIAGGTDAIRERCASLLNELGGWFEVAANASPTRVEFDKALVNLSANLLGQLYAIDDSGRFRTLTIREILGQRHQSEVRELASHVVEVGRAVRAYGRDEPFEPLLEAMFASCREHLDHIPSSLQWIDQQLRAGRLRPRLTPTETWLLEPLIRYAHTAGLEEAARYFEMLTRRVEHRLALAVSASRV